MFFYLVIKKFVLISVINTLCLPKVLCSWEMSSKDKLMDHSAF